MASYLARHFDPALTDLGEGFGSREELEAHQVERIKRALSVVIICGSIPRRLGADASPEELSLDKKRARRAAHALKQSLHSWKKRPGELPLTDEVRMDGAQLQWKSWIEAHDTNIANQLRIVSTYAITNGEEDWGKSAVVRLENESNWINYAFRD